MHDKFPFFFFDNKRLCIQKEKKPSRPTPLRIGLHYMNKTLEAYIKNKRRPKGKIKAPTSQSMGGNIGLPLNPMKIPARMGLKATKHKRTATTDTPWSFLQVAT